MSPSPDDLGLVGDGAKLAGLLPYLEYEIANMMRGLENRVYTEVDAGTLTSEKALGYWLEKRAMHRLLKRLQTHVHLGIDAANRVEPDMQAPAPAF